MAEAATLQAPPEVLSIDNLITKDAAKWHVSREKLYETLKCESQFVVDARGDHNLARGLAQIRSDYHPEVSDAEADNPAFAIDFMARYFSENKASQWSCYRKLYK